MRTIACFGLIVLTLSAVLIQAEDIHNPSNEEVLNYDVQDHEESYAPQSMDRAARSKFSRIMRSDKFARIVRGPTKLMRILRNGEQKFARIMRSSGSDYHQYPTQMRVLRTPEVKFTRILRSSGEPRYLRILRSMDDEDNQDYEPDM